MEWTKALQASINYMEQHLLDDCTCSEIAKDVHISSFYLQKGFKIMTGYTIGEYIKGRRLYLAALDVASGNEKVIDIAYRYGYETPESFTKAFLRFHGITPSQMKGKSSLIRTFLPLTISVNISGGTQLDYTIEKMASFELIGFTRSFSYEHSYQNIPEFWNEFYQNQRNNCFTGQSDYSISAYCSKNHIGEFGVCFSSEDTKDDFEYMIAGKSSDTSSQHKDLPDLMRIVSIPAMDWARFRCIGPLPMALQAVNTRIFHEWLPEHPQYDIASGINIEWYAKGDNTSNDYISEIWIPLKL